MGTFEPVAWSLQMEGMVTDLQLARDKQQNFDEWKREHAADKPLTMDLTVTVLTTGFWPSYKVPTWRGMNLPGRAVVPGASCCIPAELACIPV